MSSKSLGWLPSLPLRRHSRFVPHWLHPFGSLARRFSIRDTGQYFRQAVR